MLSRQRRLRGLLATLSVAVVAGALLPALPPVANEVDTTSITGSINANDDATSVSPSAGYGAALKLFDEKDYSGAYAAARGLENELERRTIQWAAIYYGGAEIDYGSIRRFETDAPNFVSPSLFKTRIEQSLLDGEPSKAEIIAQLGGAMPNTIKAQIALAQAYVADGQKDRAARIARSIWVSNFLDQDLEKEVLSKLGSLLDREAHWARAMHLMMHDRALGSERLLKFLSKGQQSLVVARAAVSRRDKDAKALLDAVDAAYQDNPIFIYSRAQRARQAGLFESATEWLNKAKGDLPDAEEWWYERRTLIRALLADGNAQLAYRAADSYREGPEGRLVEARFHAGWIAYSFLKDPQAAAAHFKAMRALSTLADSVTQADYWLGRSLKSLGDEAGARAAFTEAAGFGTVYYGLLARAELGLKGTEIRAMPSANAAAAGFEANELVRAVRLLAASGHKSLAVPLVRLLATELRDGPSMVLAARLAQSIGAHHVAISIADTADKRGFALDLFSFPKDGLPTDVQLANIDTAAIYAIAKQESHFQVDAISSAGARGLMQLMPSTAEETAAKLGVDYSRTRLTTDPAYNAILGSTYLEQQLDKFDGSLVLAAAAYNAGAGNASKWVATYGDPRADNVDPVIWVELIPFQETRKYVQRVLGNYIVYRTRLGDQDVSIKDALRRIPH